VTERAAGGPLLAQRSVAEHGELEPSSSSPSVVKAGTMRLQSGRSVARVALHKKLAALQPKLLKDKERVHYGFFGRARGLVYKY